MDAKKIRCPADEHYYDPSQNASCPFCRATVVQRPPPAQQAQPNEAAAGEAIAAVAEAAEPPAAPVDTDAGGRKTVLQWARRPRPVAEEPEQDSANPEVAAVTPQASPEPVQQFEQPPVVGWLVVVAGPGMGCSLDIRPGMNWVGRDQSMDVPIAFGDVGISARDHAVLLYDVECNGYFVKHERGRNLTYLNQKRVTSETRLKAYDQIRIHDTELLFMPLCGKRFEWQ